MKCVNLYESTCNYGDVFKGRVTFVTNNDGSVCKYANNFSVRRYLYIHRVRLRHVNMDHRYMWARGQGRL